MFITGVFDGLAVQDHLTAIALYDFRQYTTVYPGASPAEYRNYLISVQSLSRKLTADGDMRLIVVPFDKRHYDKWLKGGGKTDDAINRGMWALNAAQDQDTLKRIRYDHPDCSQVALAQARTASNSYMVLAFDAYAREYVEKLQQPIPETIILGMRNQIRAELPKVYSYMYISPLQAIGAKVRVGSRLVDPAIVPGVEKVLSDEEQDDLDVITIAGQFRPETRTGFRNYLIAVLPISLVGSAEDVPFWAMACLSTGLQQTATYLEGALSEWTDARIEFLASATATRDELPQILDDLGGIILDEIEQQELRRPTISRIK